MRVRSDGSYVSEEVVSWDAAAQQWVAKAVAIGSDLVYLILYATGIRNRVGPLQVGCWCPDRPITLPVTYAGAHGQFAGLDQVNVALPGALAGPGVIELWLVVDVEVSNVVNLTLQR